MHASVQVQFVIYDEYVCSTLPILVAEQKANLLLLRGEYA